MTNIADDNDRAILGQLPDDPREGAKQIVEAPRLRTAHDLLHGAMERAFKKDERKICTTGNWYLDDMTGGFLPGWCWVVGADTHWGKSSWAIAAADANLRLGNGVLIVSLEDSEEIYGDRLMLRRARRDKCSRINADNLRKRRLTADEHQLATEVAAKAERKPMFLDATSMKGEKIAKQIGRILDNHPIELVIIDYLGEVESEREHHSTRDLTRAMARALRSEVKARKKAILILSQITVNESQPDKWPRKHQIRDSRDVTNAAEVVAMGGWAKLKPITSKNNREIIPLGDRGFLLEKVKQGRKGFVHLPWDDTAACFLDVKGPDDHLDDRAPAPSIDEAADDCSDLDDYIDNRAGPGQWD